MVGILCYRTRNPNVRIGRSYSGERHRAYRSSGPSAFGYMHKLREGFPAAGTLVEDGRFKALTQVGVSPPVRLSQEQRLRRPLEADTPVP